VLATVALGREADFTAALDAAEEARRPMAAEPGFRRAERLRNLARALETQAEAFTRGIVAEAGKPRRYAAGEVARAITTFRLAAEEATRFGGEVLPLDVTPAGEGRTGLVRRFPVGTCAFLTPFNFPLNLGAHKVAPALAAGCPFVWKPAEKTPLTALRLAELLESAEPALPPGSWSVIPALPEACGPLFDDPRVRHLSFTGSAKVGWELKRRAAHARVTLELGGNAAAVIAPDWDLEHALDRCAISAFAYSGQVCISLQRLFVPAERFEATVAGLSARAAALQRGPLDDPATEIGPLITLEAAERVEAWIQAAEKASATLHCGGKREGAFVEPAVLSGVPAAQSLWCEEAFGPVLAVAPYDSFDAALEAVNDTPYGLQASVFSHDWRLVSKAWERLEVGQVIVGEGPAFRIDSMPYGGVKQSGAGREGLRYAMEAMTEPRLLVLE